MKAAALFDLSGAAALVTGASSGLGARFARVLAANGAAVVCVARRKDRLDALAAEINASGARALACAADVCDAGAMERAFDAALSLGAKSLITVNNAGVGQAGSALDQPREVWSETMRIDLDSVYFNAQRAAQRMVAAGLPGVIINTASIVGLNASKTLSAYAVAKAGVIQLTRALAVEYAAHSIRVNAIAPGYFITEMNGDFLLSERGQTMKRAVPLGRFGAEGDLDGTLLLLASKAGAFITGATFVVDGGQSVQLRA